MPPRQISFDELAQIDELDLASTEWMSIEQPRIDLFADATDDHQWIHIDPEKAKEGAFGTTIAHGYLTLALVPSLLKKLFVVTGARHGMNYGIDRLRFASPVPSGAKIRLNARIHGVEKRADDKLAYKVHVEVEVEGQERPAMVGDVVYMTVS